MPAPITSVMELRRLARKRVPRAFFEYADGGSYDEVTLRANRHAFSQIRFRQRVLIDVDRRSLATTIVGQPVSMPLGLAPTGLTGLQCGAGEIHAARAAAGAGIPFCLSTMSICSIEQVRAAVSGAFWFQVYVMRDRGFTRELIDRAAQAECSALVLTVDLPVQGQRHRDIRNGLTVPPKLTLANCIDVLAKPRWIWSVVRAPSRSFGNLAGRISGAESLNTLAEWIGRQFDPTLSWRDLDWIRARWKGKLLLKGIMDIEDARSAAAAGVDGIVVSNHGGRQLDGAVASANVLAGIAEAVADRCEVLFDGGIMSGQSLLKALALGARAGLIGRAYLYGLGAMGEIGVTQAIEIIRSELDVSMALTGQRDVTSLSREILLHPDGRPYGAARKRTQKSDARF
ncbi:MAG: alpha-hydroxy acid oxidase [Gammaproteobacteria bacterium]